jgi:hypothetical protein
MLVLCLVASCCQGKSLTCDGRDDAAEFADVRSAMKVLNFSDEEILNITRLLSAILHLGNVKYKGLIIGKFSYVCTCYVRNSLLLWNPKVYYHVHKSLQLVSVLI